MGNSIVKFPEDHLFYMITAEDVTEQTASKENKEKNSMTYIFFTLSVDTMIKYNVTWIIPRCKTNKFELLKVFFPHLYNRTEYQTSVLPHLYGISFYNPEKRAVFDFQAESV